ncbi:TlpA family protein disulfide reductase [Rhodopirellula sallentina]
MYVERLRDSILSGKHPLLGKTQLKLGDVNELLIGIDIRENEPEQPYSLWSLKDAPEPIIPDPGGGTNAGASSSLVGKQAPEFELDLLEGGHFSLADQRGQVVVLDFWATWCGPCLQAMPMIEGVVSDFEGDDVRLVAVNLQESSDTIRETLERLKISPDVVLDIDGVAAARYQANAIPQTVVIDRAGVIRRLYVGGGPKLGEQLREAITDALGETPPK